MAAKGLRPRDPNLAAVREKKTQRNLFTDNNPLVIDVRQGKPVRVAVEIENGPEAPIDLDISSDEPWLQPESERLSLVGAERGDCILTAKASGEGQYANLLLKWPGENSRTHQKTCLIQRLTREEPAGRPSPWKFWCLLALLAGTAVIALLLAWYEVARPSMLFVGFSSIFVILGAVIHRLVVLGFGGR